MNRLILPWPMAAIAAAYFVLVAVSVGAEPGIATRPANNTCLIPNAPSTQSAVELVKLADINDAMHVIQDDQSRWFALSRGGVVTLISGDGQFTDLGSVLDISDRVVTTFQGQPAEFGALSIALDPEFSMNGHVYIYYVGNAGSDEARLSRFTSSNGTDIDASSEEVLLALPLTTGIHVGGTAAFGEDGYLYIGVGDGGTATIGGGGYAQDTFSLMGKMLRIDVHSGSPYGIPEDNPFADGQGGAPEVFAWGLRNPFRWNFDSATGDLWLGDVGQGDWEEVDIIVNGGNYGWPIREGAHCWGLAQCDTTGLIDPVFEYAHQPGLNSVIGGVVYNGSDIPSLRGAYIFADTFDAFYALAPDPNNPGTLVRERIIDFGGVRAFMAGNDGEIYVTRTASLRKLVPSDVGPPVAFPQSLSDTGCFDSSDPRDPGDPLIPYDVISPLWSDGADKERYMALPDNTVIGINPDNDWDFPNGTVLVKHFKLNGDFVETRLMVRHDSGEWGGYSYEWNDQQSDAVLLPGAKNKVIGNQTWRFPSRSECFQCHTDAAAVALGPETAQLNSNIDYPSGIRSNQIETLAHIGMFATDPGDPSGLPRLAGPAGGNRVDRRARAYLHANCSMCHREGGTGLGTADFRYQLAGYELGVLGAAPTEGDFGIPEAALVSLGRPDKSIVSYRMHSLDVERMPPLASSEVDTFGAALIDEWITSGLGFGIADADEDEIVDDADNCSAVANGPAIPDAGGNSQLDSDNDGFGNLCDPDLNNDGIVNSFDLGLFRNRFLTNDADADLNGDGLVNSLDLGIFRGFFLQAPGPSGLMP